MTAFDDLLARVAALETGTIGLDDLPIAQLQRRLEQQWLGDAIHTVAPQNWRVGVATVTWPGGAPDSTATVVSHGLDSVPTIVLATPDRTMWTSAIAGDRNTTTFKVDARTLDGTSPAAASTQSIYWLAIA